MDLSQFDTTYQWYEHHGLEWPDEVPHPKRGEWLALRTSLWKRHYESLSPDLKLSLDQERHPSGSWERAEDALKHASKLKDSLAHLAYVRDVTVDSYHGNSLVLTVEIDPGISWRRFGRDIPELFDGFQVYVAPVRG